MSRSIVPAVAAALLLPLALPVPAYAQSAAVDYVVDGDGIPKPLTGKPGAAARGKSLLAARGAANCLECHAIKGLPAGGSKGPALDGVGERLTPAQLRLSVVDYARLMPKAPMPSFHKAGVRPRGEKEDPDLPLLSAQDVEDVVAYLASLRL
jgi:sulfur-oxidizing protein SoxX